MQQVLDDIRAWGGPALVGLSMAIAPIASAENTPTPADAGDTTSKLELAMAEQDIPGASVVVVRDGEIVAKSEPEFEAGTRFAYSNTNFILLGAIVERVCWRTTCRSRKLRFSPPTSTQRWFSTPTHGCDRRTAGARSR